ncbi:nucleotidyltransferase domain-containing protein [bacterium]|nr:nucleotidyltransferase domain-containing protein [bacterium]
MSIKQSEMDDLLDSLQERAKELNCFYQLEEVLIRHDLELPELFRHIIAIIPPGWQHPNICQARIIYEDAAYEPAGFKTPVAVLSADITIQEEVKGRVEVSYTESVPAGKDGFFLKEEKRLISTIADRIAGTILYRQLSGGTGIAAEKQKEHPLRDDTEWAAIMDMLLKSDKNLFIHICRKMLHYLYWNGIEEADTLLKQFEVKTTKDELEDCNRPSRKRTMLHLIDLSKEVLKVAQESFDSDRILRNIQKWIQEDKSRFLIRAIDDPNASISEIIDAISRYHTIVQEGFEIAPAMEKGLRVSLIRRFFSDQLEFINIAKQYIDIHDYYYIIKDLIFSPRSHGSLGGKSAGLFLASQIVKKHASAHPVLRDIRTPKTWYITSDTMINFLHYNNLEQVIEQKYKDMDEIIIEYHNIIQIFKNSPFPPEILRRLSVLVDDIGEIPIIVRSSSLLEDRLGAAFSGKYKSLFLPNQGSREQRLDALTDAIAEIYASTFGPDPIEYRKEKGLIDFFEEMGVMIQEVVGKQVGDYFFPAFAGVAFSNNDFRWSPRIKREDGLLRMVPGLGTRAVDRLSDDYPVLVSPGCPELKVSITPDEVIRYSPKCIDVINLKTHTFETVEVPQLLREQGDSYPLISKIISAVKDNHVTGSLSSLNIDFSSDDLVVTFDGIITKTPLVKQIFTLLQLLKREYRTPVDIEFAHDGDHLYLLQCRPQSHSGDLSPTPIPRDIPADKMLFSAQRYVANGTVTNVTHIVYVDPEAYSRAANEDELKRVGRAVSRLNQLLPKRQFILMGPGRWGSRGDIKLGVSVTYSDISNTAALIEIAKKTGNFTPDLSFGTHFFQDLVESSIRYLPLYPDDEQIVFNEAFLLKSRNLLSELIPEFTDLEQTIRVIDVPGQTDGRVLNILMNADLDEAVALFAEPGRIYARTHEKMTSITDISAPDEFWKWRYHMAETIARHLDVERFGVQGCYLFGSTKNATAGPASDIDLLIHFRGTPQQEHDLVNWLEGWSLTLAEMNYLKTGYRTDGLLDVHIITDDDIRNKTSYAVKIGAVTDAAKALPLTRAEA